MGKGQAGAQAAREELRLALPFTRTGIDADNGSECITARRYRDRQAHAIQRARGRPHKQGDTAHVEQTTWPQVRMGSVRYDSPQARTAMNARACHPGCSRPCACRRASSRRRSARGRRLYERPQTPFERARACPEADPRTGAPRTALRDRLDPFRLAQAIDAQLERLYALAHQRPRPRSTGSQAVLSAVEQASLQARPQRFGVSVSVGTQSLGGQRRT